MSDPVYCTGCDGCPEGNQHKSCTCAYGDDCRCEFEGCKPSS